MLDGIGGEEYIAGGKEGRAAKNWTRINRGGEKGEEEKEGESAYYYPSNTAFQT